MPSVRFWAGARALAGTGEAEVPGDTVADVLDEVRRTYPGLGGLLDISVILVDGVQTRPGESVAIDDRVLVEILPPYAGG